MVVTAVMVSRGTPQMTLLMNMLAGGPAKATAKLEIRRNSMTTAPRRKSRDHTQALNVAIDQMGGKNMSLGRILLLFILI